LWARNAIPRYRSRECLSYPSDRGYLLGENDNAELFKNPEMLRRFQDIDQFNDEDKKYILYTLDALIKNVKLKSI
jgi:hypothetical protein